MINKKPSYFKFFAACIAVSLFISSLSVAACQDFEIDGTYEGAVDLPKVLFLLKNSPNEPPIPTDGEFAVNYAYLDTGASGILLSRETAEAMGIVNDANAQFVDTGIAGNEYFNVSQPLYIGTADYNSPTPDNPDVYYLHGLWHFQVNQNYSDDIFGGPLDVLGIPVMAGRTVVLTPIRDFDWFDDDIFGDFSFSVLDSGDDDWNWDDWGDWDDWDWEFSLFNGAIMEPNDANIPHTDFQVALRFEKFISPSNPENLPPLPVLAYNPVIDNISIERSGLTSKGNWILDTGGSVSVISTDQAMALGLVDEEGNPLVEPDFDVPIGGIGGEVDLPGYILDRLSVPTLSGFNLVFLNARVCVTDIFIWEEDIGDFIVLDGVFGDNFLCDSIDLLTWDISTTPFDNLVIDTQKGLLGFSVAPEYSLPKCQFTDLDGKCGVDFGDLSIFASNWLQNDCDNSNSFCDGADIDNNGSVDMNDFVLFANDWSNTDCQYPCGSEKRPFPVGDLTGDCRVDMADLIIFTQEWLHSCDWLNFNCRNADLYRDGIVNFKDFMIFSDNW